MARARAGSVALAAKSARICARGRMCIVDSRAFGILLLQVSVDLLKLL